MNESKKGLKRKSWGVAAALVASLALAGCGAAGGGNAIGKTTLAESELETTVATYTYEGKTESITAKDVITSSSTLESAKDEEGNYPVPSAANIVSYAQNKIIWNTAEAQGIEVTDDEITAFAEEQLGSSDLESIASSYGYDVDTVKDLLKKSVLTKKLQDSVVKSDAGEMPEAPTAPEVPTKNEAGEDLDEKAAEEAEKAAYSEKKKEYADYIIKLAGDEWDAEKGTWKAADGYYATALADHEVTKDGADYNAAQAAYYAAYEQYSTNQTAVSDQWNDYVNGLLTKASITINTLTAS